MLPSKRLEYSAIVDRPPLRLPGGARLVVWPVINVEVWDIKRPMPRQVLPPPTHVTRLPDFPHWAWHEYGMRVGFWRFKEVLDDLGIKASLFTNARVCLDYRRVAEAARDAGWEFVGHSFDQQPIHVESDQLGALLVRGVDLVVERDDMKLAAALECVMLAGVIDEDAPHLVRRDADKVGLVLPRDLRDVDHLQVRFVDESGRLQRMPDAFAAKVTGSEPPQLVIDQRQQLIDDARLARG